MNNSSVRDMQKMYSDSLCRYKNEITYILGVEEDKKLEILDLKTQKISIAPPNDKLFDFSPIRIGYVNYRGVAHYIVRNPIRQFKCGTASSNSKIFDNPFKIKTNSQFQRVRSAQSNLLGFSIPEVADAVLGKYPSINEIVKKMAEDNTIISFAFDKQFAIDVDFDIYYRNKKVGFYSIIDKQIVFLPQYEYLTRCLYVSI